MTLTQLQYFYNFHDCNVFLPFQEDKDSIIVTFDLAKHLQYNELKSKQNDLIKSKEHHLIVKVRFLYCTNVQASEWLYDCTKKSAKKLTRFSEKETTIAQFDAEMDFISLYLSEKNDVSFLFNGEANKGGEIRFFCENVEIIEEKFVDEVEYERI